MNPFLLRSISRGGVAACALALAPVGFAGVGVGAGTWSATFPLPGLAAVADPPGPQWAPEQLDQLLGPIALYPDPLLAVILPASTELSDLTQAAALLDEGANPAAVEGQQWDDSVKALAHYPSVLEWMDQNIEWTTQLGQAFMSQPDDVARAVQRLRARARAAGALVDTPQQRIVIVDGDIEILPAVTDVVYVPVYNASIVYGAPPYGFNGPFLTFGPPCPVGPWLDYDWDWQREQIWVGDWRGRPWHRGHWHPPDGHRWQPRPGRPYYPPPASYRAPATPRTFPRPEGPRGGPENLHPWHRGPGHSTEPMPAPAPRPGQAPAFHETEGPQRRYEGAHDNRGPAPRSEVPPRYYGPVRGGESPPRYFPPQGRASGAPPSGRSPSYHSEAAPAQRPSGPPPQQQEQAPPERRGSGDKEQR